MSNGGSVSTVLRVMSYTNNKHLGSLINAFVVHCLDMMTPLTSTSKGLRL